jgi:predicted metal-dependent hydrolase
VRIVSPERTTAESIRLFAIAKLGWIQRQQRKFRTQERGSSHKYIDGESHYLWGRRYLLKIIERDAPPAVEVRPRRLLLCVRPGVTKAGRREVLETWYRSAMRVALPALLAKWEPVVGRSAATVYVQRMRTKWGGCNPARRNIRLNTELARHPPEFLEYVVVHELAHLRDAKHGRRFIATLDGALPNWRDIRERLNRAVLPQIQD